VKLFLRVLAILAVVVIVSGVAGYIYITRGLKEVGRLSIDAVTAKNLADGTYVGKYEGYRWDTVVAVSVKGGVITGIQVQKDHTFQVPNVKDDIIARVMEKQSTKVDVITAATVSSKAYLKAIENALSRQGK
jgi:uncharacterized protein with FMN-binding domain